jgi:hypothetical protein
MKTIFKIKLLLLCLYLFPSLHAQVNIGTVEVPAEGALLQLKSIAGAAKGGENAKEGLLLPRVSLVDYQRLDPTVLNATNEEKKEHIGLVVYNLTENANLAKGIAVWNGTRWNCITTKEINKNIGTNIKKNLYGSTMAQVNRTVVANSIEATMTLTPSAPSYFCVPQFRSTDNTQARRYIHQIAQYWHEDGYSNNISPVNTFNPGSIQYLKLDHLSDLGTMSPQERNEVWMYDETDNAIFHIQFFIMGENNIAGYKIFAILVEQF